LKLLSDFPSLLVDVKAISSGPVEHVPHVNPRSCKLEVKI